MTLLLDAGAFIAYERGDDRIDALVRVERASGGLPRTHGGIVGQVWRGPTQVRTARLIKAVEAVPVTGGLGRDAGRLLAASGMSDVIDAALVALADDGDTIVTSDPSDIARLVEAALVDVTILEV